MSKIGINIIEATSKKAVVERTTRESRIKVTVEDSPRREFKIGTPLAFLNHMLETIAWRACMNVDVEYETTNFKLTHVIAEDSGIVLGTALRELFEKKLLEGVNGSGSRAVIDEASAIASISIEGRANAFIEIPKNMKGYEKAEDTLVCDLIEFFKGFAQGMRATVHVTIEKAEDPHHAWESAFRAFGEALRVAFAKNEWRAGTTVGVKGTLK